MTHATNDDLLEYLDRTHPRQEEVAQHLASCAACMERLEDLRSFTQQLEQPGVWEQPDATPPQNLAGELAALDARLANEEASAERLVPWLRNATDTTAIPEEWRTAGVVRTLLGIVTSERDEQPGTALGLARLARRIAEQIPEREYPSPTVVQMRGQAWREEANLLRHIGEYHEALDALDCAAECFERHPTGAYDLALVDLVRAMTLSHGMGRSEEAIVILRRAGHTFLTYGDDRRSLHARLAEAACAFDMGRYDQARDIFQSLVPSARMSGDPETLARLVANVACCDAELNHLDHAEAGFQDAVDCYKALGMRAELVRARWGLARLRARRQEYEDALAHLYAIEAEFTELGMYGEAGLVLLDIAETLLALSRNDEIPAILTGLVAHFTRSGATPSAMTALAYLRDAIHERRVVRRDV